MTTDRELLRQALEIFNIGIHCDEHGAPSIQLNYGDIQKVEKPRQRRSFKDSRRK